MPFAPTVLPLAEPITRHEIEDIYNRIEAIEEKQAKKSVSRQVKKELDGILAFIGKKVAVAVKHAESLSCEILKARVQKLSVRTTNNESELELFATRQIEDGKRTLDASAKVDNLEQNYLTQSSVLRGMQQQAHCYKNKIDAIYHDMDLRPV